MTNIAILAGGLATRLRPLTERFPKAMIDINGRPFIDYQLRMLAGQGFRDIVLCLGYQGEQVERYLGGGADRGLHLRYSYDGPTLAGTGGALRQALSLLSDPFFVTYGDAFLRADYPAMLADFRSQKRERRPEPLGLMAIFRNRGRFDKSNVRFRNGVIERYDKSAAPGEMDYIDWGVGILEHAAFSMAPDTHRFDLADLYMSLVASGQLAGHEVSERFYEIGSFEGIEAFKALVGSGDRLPE
jgi:NDP-sugar pyrophosphorylase family protein